MQLAFADLVGRHNSSHPHSLGRAAAQAMKGARAASDRTDVDAPNAAMAASQPSKTAELDNPLHALGFDIDVVSADRVTGRLRVTELCCQPFRMLHGGISALIAEALASIGAHIASGFRRVAGVQLSINHHRPARVGDLLFAEATPLHAGGTIQVWEVRLWKSDQSSCEKGDLVASSKVTILSNLSVPENARDAAPTLKKHAKL